MASCFKGFKAILYKNNKLVWRQKWRILLIDILLPVFFFGLLSVAKTRFTGFSKTILNSSKTDILDIQKIISIPATNKWKLYYAPNEDIHQDIIGRAESIIQPANVYNFESHNDLYEYLKKDNEEEDIYVVTFEKSIDKILSYNISLHKKYLNWKTESQYNEDVSRTKINDYNPYLHHGFVLLQTLINNATIEIFAENAGLLVPSIAVTLQEIPYPADEYDNGLEYFFLTVLPLITILTFSFSIFFSVELNMKRDEAVGMNDLMEVNGVSIWSILLGWFLYHSSIVALTLIPVVLLLTGFHWFTTFTPMQYCSSSVLYVFLLFYCMAVVSFLLLLVLIARSSTIVYMSCMILGLLTWIIPLTTIIDANLSYSTQFVLSILSSNVALQFGFKALAQCERERTTCTLFNFNAGDDIGINSVILCLAISIIPKILFAIFMNKLHRMDRQTLEMLLQGLRYRFANNIYESDPEEQKKFSLENLPKGNSPNEDRTPPFISIRNLKKKHGVKVALDIPELDIVKGGEVTALLGTNGAGKTTLLSIISGAITSYEGSVKVGSSSRDNLQIGYCGQANVLFEHLTVEEHLQFFAKLRGNNCSKDIGKKLTIFEDQSYKNKYIEQLTSEDKRKLCLAMALVGQPQLILLDEITGVFILETRKKIRSLLEKQIKTCNSTIITSTHALDDVVLSSNFVILKEGKCIFKRKTKTNDRTNHYVNIVISNSSDITQAKQNIESHLGEKLILHREGRKFVLLIIGDHHKCREIIEILEINKQEWHIEKISYNVTALSSLMLQKMKDEDSEFTVDPGKYNLSGIETNVKRLKNIFKNRDYGYTKSLFKKKWFFLTKYFHLNLPGMLTIMLFALLAVYLSAEGRIYYKRHEPPLNLNLESFENKTIFVSGRLTENILNHFQNISKQTNTNISILSSGNNLINEIAMRYRNKGAQFEKDIVCGVDFSVDGKRRIVNILYSPVYIHSAPIAINLAMNAILQDLLNETYSISTSNAPVELDTTYFLMKEIKHNKIFIFWTISITAGLMFLFGDYLMFPYIDISTHFTRFQVSSPWYWMINFLFDIAHSLLQMAILIIFIWILNDAVSKDALFKFHEIATFTLIIIISGITKLPVCYLFSRYKWQHGLDQAYARFIWFGIVTGLIPSLILSTLDPSDYDSYFYFVTYLLASVFPHFAANFYLLYFGKKFVENYNWDNMNPNLKQFICRTDSNPCCFDKSAECDDHRSYFYNKQFGLSFLLPFVGLFWPLVSIIATFFSHHRNGYSQPHKQGNEYSGVKIAEAIEQPQGNIYGIHSSSHQEISTANMLEIASKERNSKEVGYFPENNAMNYCLTGLDLLILAGLNRGYHISKSSEAANLLIDIFDLRQLAHVKCEHYSGGNKKRLEICMAFMGFPDFVLIHNASRGLDITIQAKIWDFYLGYKEFASKTILLGIKNKERYKSLCDSFIDIDGYDPDSEEGNKVLSRIVTFRMKSSIRMDDFFTFIKNIKSEVEFQGDSSAREHPKSRLVDIKIQSTQTVSELFTWAYEVKLKSEAIENFSIKEVI